jgi:hypothetical protein
MIRPEVCQPKNWGIECLRLASMQIPMLRQKAASLEPPQYSSTRQVVFKLS